MTCGSWSKPLLFLRLWSQLQNQNNAVFLDALRKDIHGSECVKFHIPGRCPVSSNYFLFPPFWVEQCFACDFTMLLFVTVIYVCEFVFFFLPKLSEFLVNFVLSRHVVMPLHGDLPGLLTWIQWLTPSWNICLRYWENTHFKPQNFIMTLNILNILWAKPRNRLFSLLWKGFISRTFAKFLSYKRAHYWKA